jgi:phosphate transport system substrate-binding protein
MEFLVETRKRQTLVLAGFSDSLGTFASNVTLSLARSRQVKEAILKRTRAKAPPDMIVIRGYSKLLPTSCNDTEEGRHKNRRVEAWLG